MALTNLHPVALSQSVEGGGRRDGAAPDYIDAFSDALDRRDLFAVDFNGIAAWSAEIDRRIAQSKGGETLNREGCGGKGVGGFHHE